MFSQYSIDYDHKPRPHYFGPGEQSSSQAVRVDHQKIDSPDRPYPTRNDIPDVFVREFICDQIIQTISLNNDFYYFCYYCNNYIRDLKKVRQHVSNDYHIKLKCVKKYNKGLDKKFVKKSINNKSFEYLSENEKQEMIHKELDRIPNNEKHFYARKGIRLMNVVGEYAYYCKTCETSISSFNLILSHLKSESHQRLENRESLMNFIRNGNHPFPIVGLQFIIEYTNNTLNEIIYKCSFCHIYRNANQMYSHLFDFKHRINLLSNLEETNFESISENDLNSRMNEWHKKLGMGHMTRTKEMPNINGDHLEQLRAIFGSYRRNSMDSIESQFCVRIHNESDAQKVLEIIGSLKEASFQYNSHKNGNNFNDF